MAFSTSSRIVAARAARSVGQGALVVDFALYLHALHWSALAIGTLYSASLLVGAVATLIVGPASDRLGAKGFLLAYEALQILAAGVALLTTATAWLSLAAVLGAFGRGANGGAGPFAPAEQSWLSRAATGSSWGRLFHTNTAVGLSGMALGAALGALPQYLAPAIPLTEGYRLLFVIVLLGSLLCLLFLAGAHEDRSAGVVGPNRPQELSGDDAPRSRPWRVLLGFAGVNSLNGLGIGMVGPLMAYWFHLRFGVGPASIGAGMSLAFLSAATLSLLGIRLVDRFGMIDTVVGMRLLGLGLLLAIPWMPSFWLAMACYIFRAALNQGSIGSRQALFLGLVDARHRGLAATVNSLSIQTPRAIGPSIAGLFFEAGLLSWPFWLAAALQGAYLVLFQRFFRKYGATE
ncbi:MFS transporter [Acidithiobacillus sp.]|uniref:MFS transporter n=1 Tax=Acidithiobacillus sp. TaxID=1872118 RepID=UPI0025C21EE8|nr:MFS transporter [Acidithiobacillus sp.]